MATDSQNANYPALTVADAGSPETVEHPLHYNWHPRGIECIDVIDAFPWALGEAIKYIWRCGRKGNSIEQLRKAIFCLEREIERRTAAVEVCGKGE